MDFVQYLQNGLLLFIPVFLFNAVMYSHLPEFYQPACWDRIPKALDVAEIIFRFAVFLLPLLLKLEFAGPSAPLGWTLYTMGLLIYFGSWMVQIRFGQKPFAGGVLFRAAPAYTTILWLAGVAILCPTSFLPVVDVHLLFVVCVAIFFLIHTSHALSIHALLTKGGRGDKM